MALTFDQPESLEGGGNFVDRPGTYHMLVTAVDENPSNKDGAPIAALKVSCSVLAGTDPSQKDRTFDMMLWHPRAEDTNDMPKKKQARFCLATCLLPEHRPGERAVVEPTDAVGRQFVVKLSNRQKKDEASGKWVDVEGRVDVHYSDIWHVDDAEVRRNGVPLDQEALGLIPASLRKPVTSQPGNGQVGSGQAGNGAVKTAPVAPVTATRGGVDLSGV